MGFTLWALVKAALLVLNAFAVLHEDRFLRPIGWAEADPMSGIGPEPGSVKAQVVSLLSAVRWLRVPLIPANALVIVIEVLLG